MIRALRRKAAFTLIEILAVVAILALVATFVMPNFGLLGTRALAHQAEQIANQLELARQRSVVTAIPHRLLIDLDAGAYRIEWQDPGPEDPTPAVPPPDPFGGSQASVLDLAPPTTQVRPFAPLPGLFGRFTYLEPSLIFGGVETPEGWIEGGEVVIGFDRDGTSEYAEIVLDHADGASLILDVLPLVDAVRIRSETL
jgi:prepilin-type N-terminal cleavage/methylation domain-containing protein